MGDDSCLGQTSERKVADLEQTLQGLQERFQQLNDAASATKVGRRSVSRP